MYPPRPCAQECLWARWGLRREEWEGSGVRRDSWLPGEKQRGEPGRVDSFQIHQLGNSVHHPLPSPRELGEKSWRWVWDLLRGKNPTGSLGWRPVFHTLVIVSDLIKMGQIPSLLLGLQECMPYFQHASKTLAVCLPGRRGVGSPKVGGKCWVWVSWVWDPTQQGG